MQHVVFGDVHGRADKLKLLIETVKARYDAVSFYTVGDLIDRGRDSKGVIDLCIQNQVKGVYGNHEEWFRHYLLGHTLSDFPFLPIMGGKATMKSYMDDISYTNVDKNLRGIVPDTHKAFLQSLTLVYRIPTTKYILVHAGIARSTQLQFPSTYTTANLIESIIKEVGYETLLWTSNKPHSTKLATLPDGDVQIFGHSPIQEPLDGSHFIALDTGCGTCKPDKLSAVILPEREFFSV